MRWAPVLPLGVPHRSMEDDEYDGYFIPAGTIIYPVRVRKCCTCATSLKTFQEYLVGLGEVYQVTTAHKVSHRVMLRDPQVYPGDPESFNPDRWLRNGEIDPGVPKPDAFFGFGRRYALQQLLCSHKAIS